MKIIKAFIILLLITAVVAYFAIKAFQAHSDNNNTSKGLEDVQARAISKVGELLLERAFSNGIILAPEDASSLTQNSALINTLKAITNQTDMQDVSDESLIALYEQTLSQLAGTIASEELIALSAETELETFRMNILNSMEGGGLQGLLASLANSDGALLSDNINSPALEPLKTRQDGNTVPPPVH